MSSTRPQTSEDLLTQGNAAWFEGKPQKALACFTSAVALLPDDAALELILRAKSNLALCLRETGDVAAALQLYPELERLCIQGQLDVTQILRQWAIALEVSRDFGAARRLLERITPTDSSTSMDRLYWNHAMGLLNWSEGRLSDARTHLAAATAALPRKRQDAARVLAVLGNDALLSLYLGDGARAYRLVQRMLDIRGSVDSVPIASESSLVIVRAALARARGAFAEEADILRQGLDWIEQNDPEEWLHKLDLAGRLGDAALRAGTPGTAIPKLKTLCETAPFDLAWVGLVTLAQLQAEAGHSADASRSVVHLLANTSGAGAVEVEAEILATIAGLAHLQGRSDAAIVLGKMSLKYLAELIQSLDRDTLAAVLDVNDRFVKRIAAHLRGAGRFQEAVLLDDLTDRIRHYALVRKDAASEALAFQPLPFDRAERHLEANWATWRRELLAMREADRRDDLLARAQEVLDVLLSFKTTTGLVHRKPLLPPPGPGRIRISLVPVGTDCELQCQFSDGMRRFRIGMTPAALFEEVAILRDAVTDPVAWRRPAADLYRKIIGPFGPELDKAECLEIDASGILGRIPMALLCDQSACLAQRLPIVHVLNVQAKPHRRTSGCTIAHAAPFGTGPLSMPPGGLDGAATPFHRARYALGPDFTRDGLRELLQAEPAYLSIATHFEARLDRPDLSTLLLGDETVLYLSDLATADFDLDSVRVALLATCSSGVDDATEAKNGSLAAVVLEKGARFFIGTLWDIPETVAAKFIGRFWDALAADPSQDPALVVSRLHADSAARALRSPVSSNLVGGIGSSAHADTPEDWAAFAIFENCNRSQPAADVDLPDGDSPGQKD